MTSNEENPVPKPPVFKIPNVSRNANSNVVPNSDQNKQSKPEVLIPEIPKIPQLPQRIQKDTEKPLESKNNIVNESTPPPKAKIIGGSIMIGSLTPDGKVLVNKNTQNNSEKKKRGSKTFKTSRKNNSSSDSSVLSAKTEKEQTTKVKEVKKKFRKEKSKKTPKNKKRITSVEIKEFFGKAKNKLKLGKKAKIAIGSVAAAGVLGVAGFLIITGTVFTSVNQFSMLPTLPSGATVVGVNPSSEIQRGTIVTFNNKDLPGWEEQPLYIKRVIAVAGDTISCCSPETQLILNGEAIQEPYIMEDNIALRFDEVTIPDGYVFVAGDNRMQSKDSRNTSTQLIPIKNIEKEIIYLYNPLFNLTPLK